MKSVWVASLGGKSKAVNARATPAELDVTDQEPALEFAKARRLLGRRVDARDFRFREWRSRKQVAVHERSDLCAHAIITAKSATAPANSISRVASKPNRGLVNEAHLQIRLVPLRSTFKGERIQRCRL